MQIYIPGIKNTREHKGQSLIGFPNDFCVIDIETTGYCAAYDSVIEVGAIMVKNNTITGTFTSLVKPDDYVDGIDYLNDFTVELTGITDKMLLTAPPTTEVMEKLSAFIGDSIVIGHNVNFDINFLYDNFVLHGLPALSNDYVDTMRLSRRLHPEFPHHRLSDLANYYSVNYEGAHRSLVDSEITLKCFYAIKEEVKQKYTSFEEYAAPRKRKRTNYLRAKDIHTEASDFDPENPFYSKICVFTGTLERMVRKDAMQIVSNLGGINADSVTKKTNYLILGNNDYCKSIKDGKSSKQKKAEKYKLEGQAIEIIPENVFYDMISDFLINT